MREIGKVENKVKLFIQQGSNFAIKFDLSEFTTSLTDATATGQIRRTIESTTVEATFACAIDVGAEELDCVLSAAASSAIVLDGSTEARRVNTLMAYDIELTFDGGPTVRLMWGEVEIIPEVTR